MVQKNADPSYQWADHLAQAEKCRQGVEPLTELQPNLSIEQAYQVQLLTIQRKVEAGDHIVGKNRINFHSHANAPRS